MNFSPSQNLGFDMISDVELIKSLQRIRLIAFDVDGVLTDGGVYVGQERELKRFDIKDGHGIVVAQRAGITFALVSGRASTATDVRAKELGITEVHQGVRDKKSVLAGIAARAEVTADQVLFMGDDIQDLGVMAWAGCSAAPCDASPEVLSRAMIVTKLPGGRGAAREVIELVLKAQGSWRAVLEAYLR